MQEDKPFVWPQGLPPREKLLLFGAASLSDQELLALFLRTGVPGMHVFQLAQQLLVRFGSLQGILQADVDTFCATPGLGVAKFTQLQAVLELSRRVLQHRMSEVSAMTSPDLTALFLQNLFAALEREAFVVLFLDNQHRVIRSEQMFSGTINCVDVYPREIVREALKLNAVALILAHNHPSGNPEPSVADRLLTARVAKACALVDIQVLDHMVIGCGQRVSFAERGWI
ncbi:DNA repair protein RadC [Edwardsiella tarda]|uniref:RadC family protein n=1 Tax=Edwardsiella tarda TaxID=636 RepID=UPI001966E85D|nr:DNA repair protein RadC [Edwardsiella tarda]